MYSRSVVCPLAGFARVGVMSPTISLSLSTLVTEEVGAGMPATAAAGATTKMSKWLRDWNIILTYSVVSLCRHVLPETIVGKNEVKPMPFRSLRAKLARKEGTALTRSSQCSQARE